jgi:hypothetical protein
LRFLSVSSIFGNDGINVNQEIIYRYLIPENNEDLVFEHNVLLRIKSDGPTLIVFVNDQQRKLIDIILKKNFNISVKADGEDDQDEGLVPGHPENMKNKVYDDHSVRKKYKIL